MTEKEFREKVLSSLENIQETHAESFENIQETQREHTEVLKSIDERLKIKEVSKSLKKYKKM